MEPVPDYGRGAGSVCVGGYMLVGGYMCVCVRTHVCVFVSSYQATKVLIGKHIATKRVVVSVHGVNGSERHCLHL